LKKLILILLLSTPIFPTSVSKTYYSEDIYKDESVWLDDTYRANFTGGTYNGTAVNGGMRIFGFDNQIVYQIVLPLGGNPSSDTWSGFGHNVTFTYISGQHPDRLILRFHIYNATSETATFETEGMTSNVSTNIPSDDDVVQDGYIDWTIETEGIRTIQIYENNEYYGSFTVDLHNYNDGDILDLYYNIGFLKPPPEDTPTETNPPGNPLPENPFPPGNPLTGLNPPDQLPQVPSPSPSTGEGGSITPGTAGTGTTGQPWFDEWNLQGENSSSGTYTAPTFEASETLSLIQDDLELLASNVVKTFNIPFSCIQSLKQTYIPKISDKIYKISFGTWLHSERFLSFERWQNQIIKFRTMFFWILYVWYCYHVFLIAKYLTGGK